MGGPSMVHCKQMPTFFSLHLNIISFKRLKFGAQIAPPRTQVALASCSGTAYDWCLPHHLPKPYRYCSFKKSRIAPDALENTASSHKETPAKGEMTVIFSDVKSRGRPALFMCPLSQQEISLKATALQQPQGKWAGL